MASALIAFLLFLLFVFASSSCSDEEVRQLHRNWMADHGRSYDTLLEEEKRFKVFKDNLRYIDEHNAAADRGKYSFRLGLTPFADLTNEEFQSMHQCFLPLGRRALFESNSSHTLQGGDEPPESVDWRAKRAVSSIKDQGYCGSCWAFSAVAAVEGINKIVHDELIDLSAQQLIDCVTSNSGCNGGYMDDAFEYIKQNKGIASEKAYPYKASEGVCDEEQEKVAFIDGYEDVSKSNELALKLAVARQPVSVAVDSSSQAFQLYKSGILSASECTTNLNHAVTIVGYDIENGVKYWTVKNSWGSQWGESGYVRMQRTDAPQTPGTCGIALFPSYPTKKSISGDNSGAYVLEMLL